MRGILGTDELWGKERGAIEQEVAQDLSNPEYLLYIKLLEAVLTVRPTRRRVGDAPVLRQDDWRDAEKFLWQMVRAE